MRSYMGYSLKGNGDTVMSTKGKKSKYKVVDYYEDIFGETVYCSDNLNDCKRFVKQFDNDTDGECDLVIMVLIETDSEAYHYSPLY